MDLKELLVDCDRPMDGVTFGFDVNSQGDIRMNVTLTILYAPSGVCRRVRTVKKNKENTEKTQRSTNGMEVIIIFYRKENIE